MTDEDYGMSAESVSYSNSSKDAEE